MSSPNIDNADSGNMSGILKSWLQSFIRENMDDMLPARVVSYDDKSNRAVIKPLVMVKTTDGQKISRTQVPNIPVFRFGGGGFFIRFPLKAGDFGWLKANDRDVSLMFQRGGLEDWPNTNRLHSFSDAMFFPDTLKDWVIDGENADAMVIQSMDGSVCIALHDQKITMKAPEMEVNIPKTTWKGDIQIEGSTDTKGLINGQGGLSISGVNPQGEVATIDGGGGTVKMKNVDMEYEGGSIVHDGQHIDKTHTHSGVQTGGGDTGEPN